MSPLDLVVRVVTNSEPLQLDAECSGARRRLARRRRGCRVDCWSREGFVASRIVTRGPRCSGAALENMVAGFLDGLQMPNSCKRINILVKKIVKLMI